MSRENISERILSLQITSHALLLWERTWVRSICSQKSITLIVRMLKSDLVASERILPPELWHFSHFWVDGLNSKVGRLGTFFNSRSLDNVLKSSIKRWVMVLKKQVWKLKSLLELFYNSPGPSLLLCNLWVVIALTSVPVRCSHGEVMFLRYGEWETHCQLTLQSLLSLTHTSVSSAGGENQFYILIKVW